MEDGPHQLLERSGAERGVVGPERGGRAVVAAISRSGAGESPLLDAQLALELAEEESIPFGAEAAEELEDDDEQGGADAARGEHGVVLDVPGAGEDARVDYAPVPEHLYSIRTGN